MSSTSPRRGRRSYQRQQRVALSFADDSPRNAADEDEISPPISISGDSSVEDEAMSPSRTVALVRRNKKQEMLAREMKLRRLAQKQRTRASKHQR
jgi:hypothetical protein